MKGCNIGDQAECIFDEMQLLELLEALKIAWCDKWDVVVVKIESLQGNLYGIERWHCYQLGVSQDQYTVYPKKYAHGFVVLCFVVVMQSLIMNSHEVFIHIHQGCFAGTGAIVRLPQCQWSKPDGYGKISQCITTTKHSKAKTVCIFLGIYCKPWIPANAISLHSVIAMVDITISCKPSVSLLWIYSPLCQIKVCTWWIPANTISFHLIMAMLAIIRFNKQSMSLSALKKARGDKLSLIEDNNKHIRGILWDWEVA